MNEYESEARQPESEIREQRSNSSIRLNAKGDPQVDVKVYAGEDEAELPCPRDRHRALQGDAASGRAMIDLLDIILACGAATCIAFLWTWTR